MVVKEGPGIKQEATMLTVINRIDYLVTTIKVYIRDGPKVVDLFVAVRFIFSQKFLSSGPGSLIPLLDS